jgi:prepilin-type N-terminal cleavage/methylation domain-containing protein
MDSTNKGAFTLVELAIVIVIIGLLVGGVLTGQELVKQAKLRKFIKINESFIAANTTFYGKYNAIPGDMHNATRFFDQTECEDLTYNTIPCNSTGTNAANGLVDGSWASNGSDSMRYWIHLRLSKILNCVPDSWASSGYQDYSYCNINGAGGNQGKITAVAGTDSVFNVAIRPMPGPSTGRISIGANNYFVYFGSTPGTWNGAIVSAQDAYNIDSKIDDGKPMSGKFLAGTGIATATSECIENNEYNMVSDSLSCALFQSF